MRAFSQLLREAYAEWSADNAQRLGAALSYYTVFSVAPLLILSIAVVGMAFGKDAAQGRVMDQVQGLLGPQAAAAIQSMIAHSRSFSSGIVATAIGIATLLFGASGAFTELQSSLNEIWDAPQRRDRGWWKLVKSRFLSFTMVLGTGFLLLVSLILSALLSALSGYADHLLPTAISHYTLFAIHAGISLVVIAVLFTLIYKVLPDVQTSWRDVWIGGLMTALLFTVGKFLIGLYLGRASATSAYGAAGSLIVFLLWVYYSAQILYFGAEFTQVYAKRYGSQSRISGDEKPSEQREPERLRGAARVAAIQPAKVGT
jgi:membrane protein